MHIRTIPTVEQIRPELIFGRTAIVIDVLRASSTIVAALHSGFASVVPVETIEEADALRSPAAILAGERHCEKIAGFDYTNSPADLARAKHTGKQLILTTTNGTRAMQKVKQAERILVGCFLNATACITKALALQCDIVLCCAGTRGEFALEDGLAAGLMIHIARKHFPTLHTCDASALLEAGYLHIAHELEARLHTSITGRRLAKRQHAEDVSLCSRIDYSQIVPIDYEKRILLPAFS
ncbi:2-phosphosulfolactate phosphatase [Aneurinibacillus sp. REN35]|uniref:2-phosphosulfolactate phosphatase n=1 Tax=Aneurinibacillus sp. REN35 TaxID=3237286 RepID=UPI00352898BF